MVHIPFAQTYAVRTSDFMLSRSMSTLDFMLNLPKMQIRRFLDDYLLEWIEMSNQTTV